MKKILVFLSLALTVASAVGMYDGESISGDKTHCYYTDGTIITVPVGSSCPMTTG